MVLTPHRRIGGLPEGDEYNTRTIALQKPAWEMMEEILEEMIAKMMRQKQDDDIIGMSEEELDLKIEQMMMEYSEEDQDQEGWLRKNCAECGPPIKKMRMSLIGLDVEALFPSMTSARTGEIVRKRMMRSSLNPAGFNWKMGLVYIRMNKNLTSSVGNMWKILPFRRKVGGTEPGMSSEAMVGKKGKVEEQWCFKVKEVNREQLLEIIGRCVEIAIRVVFENFTYNFGGRIYLQREGGPIGARLTMACSRVVMIDWGDQYMMILKEFRLTVTLFKIYVDDVRQATTVVEDGARNNVEMKRVEWSQEAAEED